jgi:shikimate dehydrogenase
VIEPELIADSAQVNAGLIGAGIQASLTPALHMKEGAEQGLTYRYELFDLDRIKGGAAALAATLANAQQRGLAGVNITHPCKQSVMALLDELSDDAAALGAVNTVVFAKGRRTGHNTDWWGFAESFRRGLAEAAVSSVLLLGAGGAGAAVAYALLKLGAQSLTIFDLDAAKTDALVEKMARLFPDRRVAVASSLSAELRKAEGLVNATTMGMLKNPGMPVDGALIESRHWVAEIVYFPLRTELLRHAQATGCRTLDGGGMAVYQAVEAFRLFTGIKPDAQRMSSHFDALARQKDASDK